MRTLLLGSILLFCRPAAAGPGPGLGARAMGMGGAGTALMDGAPALFHNPAGLGSLSSLELSALAGYGAVAGGATHALALAWPLSAGVLGLAVEDTRLSTLESFREQHLAAGLAVPLSQWLWAGTRQQFLSASPGDLRGWSMDLGAHWNAAGSLWGGRGLEFGLAAQDLASQLSWAGGDADSLPPTLSIAMSMSPWANGHLDLQADLTDRADLGRSNLWRLGAEQWVWPRHGALRAGYYAGDAAPAQASAGAGLRFPLWGQAWALDYAAQIPASGPGVVEPRHIVTLSLDFGSPASSAPHARLGGLKRGADDGPLEGATILLDDPGDDSKAWEMVLRDDKGKVVRSFRGKGALPAKLEWDGKDQDGAVVAGSGVSYALRTVNHEGKTMTRHSVLFGTAGAQGALGEVAAGADEVSYGLREGGISPPTSGGRVRPVLHSSANPAFEGAAFDLSQISSPEVQTWSLKVVDEEGKTVKTFSGKGRPPKDLHWEGQSDLGGVVPNAERAGYVLRVTDAAGGERTETGDVAPVEALPPPKPSLPETDLRALAKALGKCKVGADLGECNCTFHFAVGSSVIIFDDLVTLWSLVKFARAAGLTDIVVHGFTDDVGARAANRRLSEQRADNVFDWLKGLRLSPGHADVAGLGQALPSDSAAIEESRAENRRVDVTVRRPVIFQAP